MAKIREVQQIIKGHEASDGASVKFRHYIGYNEQKPHNPFLLFDAFYNNDPKSYQADSANHSHRDFERVTYLAQGTVEHKDSKENYRKLKSGRAQFITAHSNSIRSEIPKIDHGLTWGCQLSVNLPSSLKASEPSHQDIQTEDVPSFGNESFSAKVLSGKLADISGPATGFHNIDYFDLRYKINKTLELPISTEKSVILIVVSGQGSINARLLQTGDLAILSDGEVIRLQGEEGFRVIVAAGRPVKEPVARYGSFIMQLHH